MTCRSMSMAWRISCRVPSPPTATRPSNSAPAIGDDLRCMARASRCARPRTPASGQREASRIAASARCVSPRLEAGLMMTRKRMQPPPGHSRGRRAAQGRGARVRRRRGYPARRPESIRGPPDPGCRTDLESAMPLGCVSSGDASPTRRHLACSSYRPPPWTFEVALTRICSVLLQYHLSFAVVSLAVLGVGLGGLLAYALVHNGRAAERDADRRGSRGARPGDRPGARRRAAPSLRDPLAAARLPRAAAIRGGGGRSCRSCCVPTWPARDVSMPPIWPAAPPERWRRWPPSMRLRGPVNAALVLALLAVGSRLVVDAPVGQSGAARTGGLRPGVLVAVATHTATGFSRGRLPARTSKATDVHAAPDSPGHPATLARPGNAGTRTAGWTFSNWTPRARVQQHVYIDGETPTPMLPADAAGAGSRRGSPSRTRWRRCRCASEMAPPANWGAPHDVLSIVAGGGIRRGVARALRSAARGCRGTERRRPGSRGRCPRLQW